MAKSTAATNYRRVDERHGSSFAHVIEEIKGGKWGEIARYDTEQAAVDHMNALRNSAGISRRVVEEIENENE